jgi:hypothetical protein
MPLSFPVSPTLNQQSTQNGRTYTWSGTAWEFAANVSAHASTHSSGGVDALTASDIGAAASSHTHAGEAIISGTVADARLSGNAQAAMNLYLWANFR